MRGWRRGKRKICVDEKSGEEKRGEEERGEEKRGKVISGRVNENETRKVGMEREEKSLPQTRMCSEERLTGRCY
jgi:hypothetical protein